MHYIKVNEVGIPSNYARVFLKDKTDLEILGKQHKSPIFETKTEWFILLKGIHVYVVK